MSETKANSWFRRQARKPEFDAGDYPHIRSLLDGFDPAAARRHARVVHDLSLCCREDLAFDALRRLDGEAGRGEEWRSGRLAILDEADKFLGRWG